LAFPWKVLGEQTKQAAPPKDGDQWRVNFSRVEWLHEVVAGKYRKVPKKPEDNWVWSPQGAIDMHRPERWGYVQFATAAPGTVPFRPDPSGPTRHVLHQVYYAQREFHKKQQRWAPTLAALGLARLEKNGTVRLEVTTSGFEATGVLRRPGERAQNWHIRQDSRVWAD